MKKLSIIVIGDEILLGRVTDTNSGALSRALEPLGFQTVGVRTVADNAADIKEAIGDAMQRADLVISTGGLGPTRDDVTKAVLAEIFGGEMVEDKRVTENIERIFKLKGLQMNELTRLQAWVPSSCTVINNELGTAPIMVFSRGKHMLLAMPGVPAETVGMLGRGVLDFIAKSFDTVNDFRRTELTVTSISEGGLAEMLSDYEDKLPEGVHLAYLPSPGRIVLRLDAHGIDAAVYDSLKERLVAMLGSLFQGFGAMTPAEIVLKKCRARGFKLACAESCTGGRIASAITAVAGCSDVFMGGAVTYSNDAKVSLAGVNPELINNHGAVSEEVVMAMAKGACESFGTSCAVASSGIAGPDGGTAEKPVGTVWIAAAVPGKLMTRLLHLKGSRTDIAANAADRALLLLSELLDV